MSQCFTTTNKGAWTCGHDKQSRRTILLLVCNENSTTVLTGFFINDKMCGCRTDETAKSKHLVGYTYLRKI
jgi:hypothetical protein